MGIEQTRRVGSEIGDKIVWRPTAPPESGYWTELRIGMRYDSVEGNTWEIRAIDADSGSLTVVRVG